MKRISRLDIDQNIMLFGNPETAIYAIRFADKWVAATPYYAGLRSEGSVAEISRGARQYDFEYLSSADVGEHMLHNGNPALDIQLDAEYLRSEDIIYLCHRCNKAFILELS